MSASGGEEIDLSPSVPQNAQDLAASKPDIRQTYDTTPISGTDVSDELSSGTVLELDAGDYTMSSGVSLSGVSGIIGAGVDATTINISGSHGYLFDFSGDTFIMEGLTVNISGGDTDAGLASVQYSNECWCEDIRLRGSRDKYAHDGPRMTFLIEGTSSSAVGYMHRCLFPDGGTNHPDEGHVGHAIGPNSDPGHSGLNVWHECLAANFMDNGFYVAYAEGPNILWNCVARNNAGGNMRVSTGDYIVGGTSESTSMPSGRSCKCLEVDHSGTVQVVGLEMYGEGNAVGGGSQLIQVRGDSEDLTLDRTVAHNNGGNFLARLDVADVQITGGWWYQENQSSTAVQIGVRSGNANVTADGDWDVLADGAAEIDGPITIAGTSYSGTTTADEAGMSDPQPFPQFHFSGAESGVGDWTSDGGSGGGTGGTGTGGTGTGGTGTPGTGTGAGAPTSPMSTGISGTATLQTGACGEVSVEVDTGGFNQMGMGPGGVGADDGGVPVQTNFDDMGSIGGGDDYTDTVTQSDADAVVTSVEGLQSAIDEASPGDTIFVPSDPAAATTEASMLMTDGGQTTGALELELDSPVELDTNEVTLASDRGVDGAPGATLRLRTTADSERQGTAVRATGEACRITGLIIEGVESGGDGDPDSGPYGTGVRLDAGGCEVDNCEIRSFPTAGVYVAPLTAAVHHNTMRDVGHAVRLQQSQTTGGSGTGGGGGGGADGIVGAGGSGDVDCAPATSQGGG